MMNNAKYAAENAIRELATRPAVFTAEEVASLADLSRDAPAVAEALRLQSLRQGIVFLGELHVDAPRRYFLGRDPALRWWARHNLRLAQLGIDRLTPAQLRAALALAFDCRSWHALPANLLDLGRRGGLVAPAGAGDALVFPWATLLRANPAGADAYRAMFLRQSPPAGLRGLTLDSILDQVLARLPPQQADVLRKRYGIAGARMTLAQLGDEYCVTRERIRQIQTKATRQLAQADFQLALWWAFVNDFMRGGCALVIPDARLTPQRRFLYAMIRLVAHAAPELNARIIGPAQVIDAYRAALRADADDAAMEAGDKFATDELTFLPARERATLITAEQKYRDKRIAKSMPRMIVKALRKLGRAAHYSEIAQTCNELFPHKHKATRSWHNALSQCAKPGREQFGIVWTGVKGMYGLKSHGYWRPAEGLYESIPRIVRERFAATGRPVAFETVVRELSELRREFNHGSVQMALTFSDQVEKTAGGYLPATPATESKHDITAAMQAFTDGQDAQGG